MSVLVYADSYEGKIRKSAWEVLTYGRKIAKETGVSLTAIAFGRISDEELTKLANYGAAKIMHVSGQAFTDFEDELFTKAFIKAASEEEASIMIFPFDNIGKSLASRVAVGLGAGLVSGVTSLPDMSNGFTVKKTVFSGKAIAEVELLSEKKVLCLSANTIPATEEAGTGEIVEYDPGIENSRRVAVVEVKHLEGDIPLTEAEVVVSAGRGLKGPENWGIIEDLARSIGAATACSRPVSDIGWRPHHEHVGQTGTTIRPNLYIAIGISGAIQHLAGVNGSKTIVVINKDAEAPFFKAANYGVLGDAFEVIPKLTAALQKFKSQDA
jgi:electron transfer flavoprotein alpha subunit